MCVIFVYKSLVCLVAEIINDSLIIRNKILENINNKAFTTARSDSNLLSGMV